MVEQNPASGAGTSAGETSGSAGQEPPTPAGGQGSPNGTDAAADLFDGQPFDAQRARHTINVLREERRGDREALRQAQEELRAIRSKDLPEGDRLQAEIKDLKGQIEQRDQALRRAYLQAEIAATGARLNVIDPELVMLLLESRIQFDDEGKPRDVEKAIRDLIKERPHLVRASGNANAGDGSGGGPPPKGDFNAQIRKAAGRAT